MERKRAEGNRIDEELICMECLEAHLNSRLVHEKVVWRRVPPGKDPPDFWLSVGSSRFPVEVTSLVEDIATPDRVIKSPHYSKICEKTAGVIEERAKAEGSLSGTYMLTIKRTPHIHPNSQAILENALAFLRQTSGDAQHGAVTLYKSRDGVLEIEKLGAAGARVHVGQARGKWEGEIQDDLQYLLEERLSNKRTKLEGLLTDHPQVILLLYDAYLFADLDDLQTSINRVKEVEWFHSVFWVQASKTDGLPSDELKTKGLFLHTKEENWV